MTPRRVALGLGIAFAALTALELLFGELSLGDARLLQRTTKANILHWIFALTLLGAFFARSSSATRTTLRIDGGVLFVISLGGVLWSDPFGSSLGFGGGMPTAYTVLHAVAALVALSGGFLRSAERV